MRLVRAAPLLFILIAARSPAQVDPSGRWRTLHTEHFRVHFRPAQRALAGEAAREAERAYALLASELHPPRGVVDLTLADDIDAANGFASTYPSNRIALFLPPPVADPGLQTYDSWLRLVIVHELAHVFHLDRSRGFWAVLQSVFGRTPGLFPNEYQPSWVIEGLATYYESRFTAGGRAAGTFHRQIVAAEAGAPRSPWDALFYTRWPNGLGPYAYGSRFFNYLAATAGDTVVPRFVEGAARQLIPYRVGRQLRRAGAPRALSDGWAEAIALAAPRFPAPPSRRLAGALRSAPVPRVAPDGTRIAYLYDDGRGAAHVRVMDAAGQRVLRAHAVTGQVSYDWLGDTLVVAQLEFTDRRHVRSDLWRWTPDGAWRRATRGARLMEPRTGGGPLAAVALLPGDNAPVFPLPAPPSPLPEIPDPPGTTWGAVVPSPDGRWVAATRHQGGHWALVRWPAAAPDSIAALVEAPVVSDPTWTPDGEGLLYVTDVGGFPQVHRWDAAAGARQVTAEPLGARAPASLPDGTLLFTTLARDGWELRAAVPIAAGAEAPPFLAPFDSAPAVPVRETGYAPGPSLRPHFWLPLGWDAGAAGTFVGGVTAGSDAVGRYAYLIEATLSTAPMRGQGYVGLLTHALGNPTLDVSASNEWSVIGSTVAGRAVLADDLDAALAATFVTQRWRGFASLRLAAEYEGRRFAVAPDTTVTAVCALCLPQDLAGGSVAVRVGHGVSAPLAVSPQDGFAASLLYRRREEQGTGRWSGELRGRVALYARVPPRVGFAHTVLALRVAAGTLDGSLPRRFSAGGVSSGTVGVGFGQSLGPSRTFPVRGYAAGTRAGRRAATATAELRLPLALVGRSLGHLPFGADKLSLALFGDAGDAWDPGSSPRLLRLRSAGAELVADVAVNYDLLLRVRLGVAEPAGRPPQLYAALASDF